MASERSQTLFEQLEKSGLLSPDQLKELAGLPEARDPDPRVLGRVVVQRGLLTRYQVAQVAVGKARDLFVGAYLLLDRLGEGGMGQVFKARHQHMRRTVALKVIRKEKLADTDSVQRFYQEVEAAARLSHPNIVIAHDAGQVGATHFLAMEFVPGVDLARLVKQRGPLPIAQACSFIRQAAQGLQHAHEKGMVHRDIKPHNLLVTMVEDRTQGAQQHKSAVVKILDMGLARLSGTTEQERALTQTGSVMGTPEYLAPEQALDSRQADIRSDIYSLGCTFYFLLSGRAPFQGDTLTQVLLKHQMEECKPLGEVRGDIPPALERIVRKMMAKEPEKRFQTPAEAAAALEAFSRGGADAVVPELEEANPFADIGPEEGTVAAAGGIRRGKLSLREEKEPTQSLQKNATSVRESGPHRRLARSRRQGSQKLILIGGAGGVILLLGAVLTIWLLTRSSGASPTGESPPVTEVTPTPTPTPTPKPPVLLPEQKTARAKVDENKGGVILRWAEEKAPVRQIAFSPGGDLLGAAREDGLVKVWNTATGEEVSTFKEHGETVRALAFSPEGNQVVSASSGRIQRWNPMSGLNIPMINPRLPGILSLCFDPSGQAVVGGCPDTIYRWYLDGRPHQVLISPSGWKISSNVALAPDGRALFVGGDNGFIYKVSKDEGPSQPFRGHEGPVLAVAYAPTLQQVLSGGKDRTLRLWDSQTQSLQHTLEHPGEVIEVQSSPDGRLALTLCSDNKLRIWDLSSRLPLWTHRFDRPVRSARFSPAESVLAVGAEDGEVFLLEPPKKVFWTGSITSTTPVPPDPRPEPGPRPPTFVPPDLGKITHVARVLPPGWMDFMRPVFSPDGREVLMVRRTSGVILRMVDPESGISRRDFPRHLVNISAACFDTLGKQVLVADVMGSLRLNSAETGETIKDLVGHKKGIRFIALTPDGRYALSAGERSGPGQPAAEDPERGIRVWDTGTGSELRRYRGHQDRIEAMALSPDGTRVFSASRDHVALWEVATAREAKQLRQPRLLSLNITQAMFYPDGRRLMLLTRSPSSVLVWDLDKDVEVHHWNPPVSGVAVDLSPGGQYYAVAIDTFTRDGDRVVPTRCEVHLRKTSDNSRVRLFEGFPSTPRHVVFTPDGSRLLAVTPDGAAVLLDTGITDPRTTLVEGPKPAEVRPRQALPGEEERTEARKLVRDTYREDYARQQPAERISLAMKLLEKAGDNPEGSPARYILLEEAQLLATSAGSATIAMQAADRLASEYEVDLVELQRKVLTETARACDTPLESQALVASCLLAVRQALEEENFGSAQEVLKLAELAAVKTSDPPLVTRVRARVKEVQEIEKEYQAAEQARETLTSKPEDAEASLTRGRYLCLRKGSWAEGLPLLARGSDARLKDLAARETAGMLPGAEQLKLADDWLAAAAEEKEGAQQALKEHALHWYETVLPSLAGLDRDRVEKRVKELTASLPADGIESLTGEVRKLEGHTARVTKVRFLPGDKQVLSTSLDGKVGRWDLETGKMTTVRSFGSSQGYLSMTISADHKWLVTSSTRGILDVLSLDGGGGRTGLSVGPSTVRDLTFLGKSDVSILYAREGGHPAIWSSGADGGTTYLTYRNLKDSTSVCSSVEGRFGYIGTVAGPICVLEVPSRQITATLLGHTGPVNALAVSPDGQLLASAGEDGTVRIWSLQTMKALRVLKGHAGPVRSVAASRGFEVILSGGDDRTVRLWESRRGILKRAYRGHTGPVWSVDISSDGSRGISASEDSTLRMWDLRSQ